MKNIRPHITLLLLIINFTVIAAQDVSSTRPVAEVLKELQTRFGYQFNYASETVDKVEVVPPSKELNFNESLNYLNERTRLIFTVLENKFVSVKKPDLQLCGYLKDKNTQEPIADATVQGSKNSTITDENGYFELKPNTKNDVITIRHVGYKTLDRSYQFFKEYTCGNIYLVADELQLAEIVLSDFLIKGIDKLNDGSFKIDFDRFSILPGLTDTDVLQSVQAFPGIQSINETVSDINIRGGTNDQNLILWDGIKMYQSGHFFGLISMYNPQITQKVSLRKNGTPVSFTDGVSGTIAMETDSEITKKFEGNIGINFLDANAFADVPLGEKSSIQIAARKAISNFVQSPTYTAYFDRIRQDTEVETNVDNVVNSDFEFDFYDTSLRWLYKPTDKDEIQLNFINTNNELIFNENATFDGIEESRRSSVAQNSIAGGLQYQRSWNDRVSTSLHVYETDYTLKAANANILNNQQFSQENSVSETGVKLEGLYQLTDEWRVQAGYQYVETKVTNLDSIDNPRFIRLEAEVLRTHAGFAQLGYISKDRMTTLNAGVRYNYLDKFNKHIWEPRFSFNQRFLNAFNLEILGEFKHQNTSQIINFQNDFLGIEKRRWRLSNDGDIDNPIPVITSKQLSTGLSYSDNGWLLNLVGYFKNVDGITTSSQGFQNQYEFESANGSYVAAGMDVLLRKQFKNLNAWLSYSYLTSDYTFESLPDTNFSNNLEVINSISLGTTYTTSKFLFSAGLNWRSGKPITVPVAGNELLDGSTVNYGPVNQERLDDYMRVDVSAIYQFKLRGTSKVNIGVSVWNLLNKENTINNFYRINVLGEAEEVEQNSLGITPNAVFRVYF